MLLVAPTWNEIEAVTEKVRAALKTSGRLAGDEKEFQVFDSLSWTEAQKRDARQYRPGLAIRFHRQKTGFAKDETVAVVAVENDAVKVQRADGSESIFPLGQGAALFDVGEKRKLKIAAGDKLLLQSNWQKKFINGELVEVRAIQGDSVVLADGRVIPENYRTFTHGYAVTSHAAQMPEQFIIGAGGRVQFALDDFLVFLKGDGATFLMPHDGPVWFGQNRQRHPAHIHRVIVDAPQKHIGRNGTGLEHRQKMFRRRFNQLALADQIKGRVPHRGLPTVQGVSRLEFDSFAP